MFDTLAEGLARLFRDNMWKLYRLLESAWSKTTICNTVNKGVE